MNTPRKFNYKVITNDNVKKNESDIAYQTGESIGLLVGNEFRHDDSIKASKRLLFHVKAIAKYFEKYDAKTTIIERVS